MATELSAAVELGGVPRRPYHRLEFRRIPLRIVRIQGLAAVHRNRYTTGRQFHDAHFSTENRAADPPTLLSSWPRAAARHIFSKETPMRDVMAPNRLAWLGCGLVAGLAIAYFWPHEP